MKQCVAGDRRLQLLLFMVVFCWSVAAQAGESPGGTSAPLAAQVQGKESVALDLEAAQRLALAANPSMAAAGARLEQARARVRQAMAAWYPSLDLSASGRMVRLSDKDYEAARDMAMLYGSSADRTTEDYSLGVQATWVLFDGFYRKFNQQQAEFGEKSLDAARRDARRLLLAAVAEAFYNAQLQQAAVEIAAADARFYAQQLRDAQNRFEVGTGSRGDVLNIKVQLNSARTALLLNKRQYEAALYGLAALLGLPDGVLPPNMKLAPLDREVICPDPAAVDRQAEVSRLLAEALETRPDIQALAMQIRQAEAAIGMAKASDYPSIQLAGGVNGAREGDMGFEVDDFGSSIMLSLGWNLYSGGGDRARQVEARLRLRELRHQYADLRNRVASEIRQDMALLQAAEEQVELQRQTVELVRENRELAEAEYQAGTASIVRLNEAQRNLTTTHGRLAQALVNYHLARQRLLAATGRNLAAFAGSTTTAEAGLR
ncbi:TolC family protein [Desulfolithobacter sp.]